MKRNREINFNWMWVPKIFVLGISIANPSNTFGGILSHASKVTQLDLWSKVIMLRWNPHAERGYGI